jgi:2-polyprenyl-3-methyl-5-hydroxy-6-metoxy-1,4-benzoquinol methylase
MVARFEVELAYRFFLGREPESAKATNDLAARCRNLAELRQEFMNSDEFKRKIVSPTPMSWPRSDVEVNVSPEYLQKMMRRVEHSWEELGKTEPYWSVLSHNKFLLANIEQNKDDFFASGRTGVELFTAALRRMGITDLSLHPTCLEYGCGLGRLTIWLADLFEGIVACDISQPHLDAARIMLDQRGISNVSLIRTNSVDAVRHLPGFDVFFSLIVLQHNPPPVAMYILFRLLEKLNCDGLAYFQIPTYRFGYHFDANRYINSESSLGMEMHAVPQHELFALFQRCGCAVLEVREDHWTGDPQCISNTFLLQKQCVTAVTSP